MSVNELGSRVASLLEKHQRRIVFAESCTAGLVAASLSQVPGISSNLCGSMVTYRSAEKTAWLGISEEVINTAGAVSANVAQLMAANVLERTVEAHLACSVTGHLGPQAPAEQDGLVYIGLTNRPVHDEELVWQEIWCHRCKATSRIDRQLEVVEQVLSRVESALRRLKQL